MSDQPVIVRTRDELARALDAIEGTRALVMTMGALHEGHLSLVRRAHELADRVIVSIFVNPTQFAPGEDFDSYPRTLDADVAALNTVGVDVIYAPEPEDVYPAPARITLDPGPIARVLEGTTRPTHLAGVALVVTKVINRVQPDIALFGQKDAQQLAMIRTVVSDLDIPVRIEAVPIARDSDGVALSSRNAYLSLGERVSARSLSASLNAGLGAASAGARATQILAATRAILDADPGVDVDYVALADPHTFDIIDDSAAPHTPAVLLVAATVGTTRLIDNALLTIGGTQ